MVGFVVSHIGDELDDPQACFELHTEFGDRKRFHVAGDGLTERRALAGIRILGQKLILCEHHGSLGSGDEPLGPARGDPVRVGLKRFGAVVVFDKEIRLHHIADGEVGRETAGKTDEENSPKLRVTVAQSHAAEHRSELAHARNLDHRAGAFQSRGVESPILKSTWTENAEGHAADFSIAGSASSTHRMRDMRKYPPMRSNPPKPSSFELVFADAKGKVFNFPGLKPAGMKAGAFFGLEETPMVRLPDSSELFLLPDRRPVGIDPRTQAAVTLESDPYSKKPEPCFAVAAFIPPGHTLMYSAAYREGPDARALPLFAYGACLYAEGHFYVPAVQVDRDIRHDERYLPADRVLEGVARAEKRFPKNRLVTHLKTCATANGCANAKNFFLGRLEAPMPTSPVCNAQCQGCISLQPENRDFPSTQKRISFKPEPEEIAELALFHFESEADPTVSFGQGCEGEPTLAVDVIERAIRLIRKRSGKGFINVNTNASRPEAIRRLFEAGLTHIRVSLNSVREPYYSRYYQPKGYCFGDVAESVRVAKRFKGFVSLNYLSMPGFTDSKPESDALIGFVGENGVDMIQWRNLNYDPVRYFRELGLEGVQPELLGMDRAIARVAGEHPKVRNGYFNPRPTDSAGVK